MNNNTMPKISVITINYNNRDGLRKTIESVVNQTYNDFEYIIIDGGSTDGSVDVIKEYDGRIDYWVSEPDKGIYNAMNKGIDVAKGEYCIFINSGDYLNSCEVLQISNVELDGVDVITGSLILDNGEIWAPQNSVSIKYLYNNINTLSHPASFIKSALLKKYHYDENLKIVSDWKFFVQVLLMDNASYKPLSHIITVFDTNGISSTNYDMCIKERQYVLENDFPKSILDYFLYNTKDYDAQLFNIIRESKYRGLLYTLNICVIKFVNFFSRKSWAKRFPIKLNKR